MQERVGEYVRIHLQGITNFIPPAAAAAIGMVTVIQSVGGIEHDQFAVLLDALKLRHAAGFREW